MNRGEAFQQINEQLTNDYTIKSLFAKLKLISGCFVSDNHSIGFESMYLERSQNDFSIDYYTGCGDDLAGLMLEYEYDPTTPSGVRFKSTPWEEGDKKKITTAEVIKIMHAIKLTLWQIEHVPMDAHTSNGPCIDFPSALLRDHINNQTLLNNPF